MDYMIDPVEHGRLLEALGRLKEDIRDGKLTIRELADRLDELERKARENEQEHLEFVKQEAMRGIQDSLKKLENSVVVMTPKQAKDAGSNWFSILLKNPTNLMWIILGVVVLSMVIMGYSYVEISQVLDRLR